MNLSTALAIALLSAPGLLTAAEPRLNEIQVIGSHNSYHLAPPAALLEIMGKFRKEAVAEWSYSHPGLTAQLQDEGLRQLELDVYADPQGGLFSKPFSMRMGMLSGKALPAFDPDGELLKPGFKILHVADLDCWSNSPTLSGAIQELAAWSAAHTSHVPILILIECKDDAHPPMPTKPLPFTRERLLDLEKEILSILPPELIFRPDDLRGAEKSLPDAIRKHGWPMLSSVRGKFLFALDNEDAIRDRYLESNPALEGRLMFVSVENEDDPAAAWFKRNDAKGQAESIRDLVGKGFLVRTRAENRAASPETRDAAFASGAQWISTDHFSEKSVAGSRVAFPDGKQVRSNPITGVEINQGFLKSP